ncbi:sulfurtransferase [Cryobacterium tagatosivorans]|uniref:Sulfurtransferase n=1 Tax=Cryobacterium tagatosivorans TaxID=1259199 RepID=A0A4V3I6T1_9MICO|nr:sulfurtransferase [Cryobacterium tagatosivorans]TFB55302.1 sulfurtransferase [Cryobacterium tagatosivorans]
MRTLITAEDLAAALAADGNTDGRTDGNTDGRTGAARRGHLRLLDVRWKLGGPPGRTEYLAGHLPGAAYVDLDEELAGHGAPTDGRHPLPSIDVLQEAARRWGLNDGDTVVVYDDLGNLSAARAWWLLRHAGVRDVLLLDGSLAAWRDAGLPLVAGEEPIAPGAVTLAYGRLATLDVDAAAALPGTGVLLDARAAERYRGDTEPIDPRAGHIPGAISAPTTLNLGPDGGFLPAGELRARFERLGVTDAVDVGVYCGSGVTAAHQAAALAVAGFRAALYPGSWSQWSNLPGRPVETGDLPGRPAESGDTRSRADDHSRPHVGL